MNLTFACRRCVKVCDLYSKKKKRRNVISRFRLDVNEFCVLVRFYMFLDCLTLEEGTDRLSRKVGVELPSYAKKNPQKAQI